ncbi:hypothetical protein SAMN05660772_01862 [Pasteurella testudinis DSM 23072]|uniref:Uncharacterized protein n=1 Tax=Pasteurella testudinis DSM 23072 TaxID=1122938 RepID=A0A1W1UK42_9PAST|nr:hypothetical protein SAMN05660772_01862 [Pasteurella testudinis DSM 23072]SUB51420.1 Uncharacterised protein [Pasteurella testudinis]
MLELTLLIKPQHIKCITQRDGGHTTIVLNNDQTLTVKESYDRVQRLLGSKVR